MTYNVFSGTLNPTQSTTTTTTTTTTTDFLWSYMGLDMVLKTEWE